MEKIFLKSKMQLAVLIIVSSASAQQPLSQDLLQNKTFGRFLNPESKQGWIKFTKDAPYTATEIFKQQPELLGMRSEDEMRLMKTSDDAAGNHHYHFAQLYKGVRLELVEHRVHAKKDGHVYLMNGDFIPSLSFDVNPTVSTQQAIDAALKEAPAKKYLWEDATQEANFKKKKKDENATLYPKPELLIVKKDPRGDKIASNYVLAYRVDVFAKDPYASEYVYIDAHTGQVIRKRSLDINCSPGTATTTFNGTQSVNTKYTTDDCWYTEETSYFAWDDCNSNTEVISWYSASYGSSDYGDDFLICDDDNNWTSTSSTRMVISTLWATKKAYSYYMYQRGHEGFDGSGGQIDCFSNRAYFDDNDNFYCKNANYTNIIDNLNFGSGADCSAGTTDDFNTDDIVGHEFTHGVIEYAHFDALDYSGESGALNESFADIFGEAIESYVEGSNDFLEAADKSDGAIRSFSAPKNFGDPDTYYGVNWADLDGNDNGGVHTNSGVQNHIFYLLSQGGSGTNDLGDSYNVTGIGFSDASDIAWQAMMEYLNSDDGYVIAHDAWIQAAIDLFGSCSQQVISVGEAFMAAGVTHYTSFNLGSVCGTYSSVAVIDGADEIMNAPIVLNDFVGSCTATVSSGAVLTLSSGNSIDLVPGFSASSGCVLIAQINPCEKSDYDPDNLKHGSPNVTQQNSTGNILGDFTIYPVPCDRQMTVEYSLENEAGVSFSIVDVSGKEITSRYNGHLTAGGFKEEFETASFVPGVYLCLIHVDGKVLRQKFVVQH